MNNAVRVNIKLDEGATLPEYLTEHAAGADLVANEDLMIMPGKVAAVKTGVYIEVPIGYEAQVRPRSGNALNSQVGVLNSPGTIDADYRGEVKVILKNFNPGVPFEIKKGKTRIAQLIIAPVAKGIFNTVDTLSETTRGEGGFGHTGLETNAKAAKKDKDKKDNIPFTPDPNKIQPPSSEDKATDEPVIESMSPDSEQVQVNESDDSSIGK